MTSTRTATRSGPGPIAGLAFVALPALAWWVGLAVCLRVSGWLAVAWVLGPGVVAMAATAALEVVVLRLLGLWGTEDSFGSSR